MFEYIGKCDLTNINKRFSNIYTNAPKMFYKHKRGWKDMYNMLKKGKKSDYFCN